jgi:hypothetical protein
MIKTEKKKLLVAPKTFLKFKIGLPGRYKGFKYTAWLWGPIGVGIYSGLSSSFKDKKLNKAEWGKNFKFLTRGNPIGTLKIFPNLLGFEFETGFFHKKKKELLFPLDLADPDSIREEGTILKHVSMDFELNIPEEKNVKLTADIRPTKTGEKSEEELRADIRRVLKTAFMTTSKTPAQPSPPPSRSNRG